MTPPELNSSLAGGLTRKTGKLPDVYDNLADVFNDRMREKALEQARRAIACAGGEPQLQRAVEPLRSMLE